ncbi:MAG: calcium-translocating P-type ATPase, PMCA-type [Defluviitaleaceae bacterium]|nr:calcium-translocating P-type ATPase, PMCA-type [Defluviitaleaceae bacterium]
MDDNFKGLSTAQAAASKGQHGDNRLTKKARVGFFTRYLASFGDPIIKILLLALGVNLLLLFRDANWYESVGIGVAVLLATLISTLSEYGSESVFEKLQEEAAFVKCRVLRDGRVVELDIGELAVGDVVHIGAGEKIPADGVIVAGAVDVDQSALNGETKEAAKAPGGGGEDFLSPSGLFRGSVVCAGEGMMLVTRVGDGTFYGMLALDVQEAKIESPLKARLTQLSKTISRFGYGAAIVVVGANLFNNILLANNFSAQQISLYFSNTSAVVSDVMMAITLGITVIVMAVPEGLPMMITVVLSANMRRMLKSNVLVRKLVGIETSGSLNILFTDKTGTLTRGLLEVTTFICGSGRLLEAGHLKNHGIYKNVALNCFYNNGAQITSKKMKTVAVGGNSTDRALLEYVMKDAARLPLCQKGFTKPFNSKDKLSITAIHGEAKTVLLKGAPENLLPACTFAMDEKGHRHDFAHPAQLRSILAAQSKDGIRLLALCEAPDTASAQARRGLTLVGFVGIRDEIRPEAKTAITEVMNAGVQVVMVTGDNRDTAASVATKLGLIAPGESGGVLTSRNMNNLTDAQLKKLLPKIRVISRALPSDKGRLVRLAQELDLVAGMTGDGVNDAPALKKSDVGFSMGSGTEIAKEASDIVILDNNFVSIVKSILYGRTIFKSIRKFLIFQLSINLCAVGISVIGPFIGVPVPVTVIQMLWINMIMDTLAGLAYAGEPSLPEYMKEAPKKRTEPIINRYMFNQILVMGIYTTLLSLAFFKLPFFANFFRNSENYLLTAFFGLFIFAGVFNSLNARTYRLNLLAYIERNKMFIAIMLAVSAMQLLLIYLGGTVFRTTGLSLRELAMVIALASTVILCDLGRKVILRMYDRKGFI